MPEDSIDAHEIKEVTSRCHLCFQFLDSVLFSFLFSEFKTSCQNNCSNYFYMFSHHAYYIVPVILLNGKKIPNKAQGNFPRLFYLGIANKF